MRNVNGSAAIRLGVVGIFFALMIVGLAGVMQANAGVSPQYTLNATIKPSVEVGVSPLAVNFTAALSGGGTHDAYTYAWSFGDGSTSTLAAPTHAYTSVKTFAVTLAVTDTTTKITADAPSVNIIVSTSIAVVISTPKAISGGYQFSASATGGTAPYTFNWAFGDGTTGVGANVTHPYATAQTYNVTVQVTDSNGLKSPVEKTQVTVTSTSGNTQNGGSNNSPSYVWLYIVILVILVAIFAVLLYRRYKTPSPPPDMQGQGGPTYAPYQYQYDQGIAGSPGAPPASPEAPLPAGTEAPMPPPPADTGASATVAGDAATGATAASVSSQGADPAPSGTSGGKTCFVCGGSMTDTNYCPRCQMDWNQQSVPA